NSQKQPFEISHDMSGCGNSPSAYPGGCKLRVLGAYIWTCQDCLALTKEQSEVDSHHREETMNRIKELQDFIAGQKTDITEFDEALVKKLIEKITVFADHFTVEFKSGITIDIEA
ncbi:MAG: hypothetical protein MR596_04430, partial [Lachnospiraceae bacterium]|nr:hypothetical protein [Lachnospiraceae bacterium]